MINLDVLFGRNNEIQIAERKFDAKYNVWRPWMKFHDDKSFSYGWEVVGVADSFEEASAIRREMSK